MKNVSSNFEGSAKDPGAAWCIEGPKEKNELRSFIYLKMTFFLKQI